jgi:hypothetical protein
MLRFVCVIALMFTSGYAAMAAELPAESPIVSSIGIGGSTPPRDKWLRVGLIWSATALDLVSTRYALSSNPAMRESNPILTTNDGRLRTGMFLGVSLPLDALASYANLKYPHSRSIRILTYVTSFAKLGIGIQNFRQGK